MKENLFIRSHRYTTPEFRDNWDEVFKKDDELHEQIKEEMEKGEVHGHFC